jgi:hypothetical protein
MSSLTQDFLRVPDLVRDYALTTFVETGCESCVSLGVAHSLGLRCISCDVNGDYVAQGRARYPNAEISHAESLAGLAYACSRIGYDEPCLVWLDAHWGPPPYDTYPVKAELEYLLHNLKPLQKSVILVDDFSAVMAQSLTDPDLARFQGSAFVNYTAADLCALLPDHDFVVLAENTGVAQWTPKART